MIRFWDLVSDPVWLGVVGVGVLGSAGIRRLYRIASDPVTRLRDSEGREIEPAELEGDEPREWRGPPVGRARPVRLARTWIRRSVNEISHRNRRPQVALVES
jgi:hypothetical protein